MLNFTGELLNLPDRQEYYVSLWIVLVTVAVAMVWGPETLTGRRSPPHRLRPRLK